MAGTVVFGWVFAAHQIGAAVVAWAAGETHALLGTYAPIWYGAAGLCIAGAGMALAIRAGADRTETGVPTNVVRAGAR